MTLNSIQDQLCELKKFLSVAKLPGGGLSSEQKMWEDYEERRKELDKEDSEASSFELNRRHVIKEMKELFNSFSEKGKEILSHIPDDELEDMKLRRQQRLHTINNRKKELEK